MSWYRGLEQTIANTIVRVEGAREEAHTSEFPDSMRESAVHLRGKAQLLHEACDGLVGDLEQRARVLKQVGDYQLMSRRRS